MATIVFYFACFCLVVAITMVIPGLNTIVTPIWAAFGKGVILFCSWSWGWLVYFVKIIFSAHIEISRHLILKEEEVDVRKSVED